MVVSAAVRSKLAILLSFSQYLMLLPVHVCVCVCVGGGGACFVVWSLVSLSCYACVFLNKRELVALLY